ncbi:MAG TPA: hypothetical protein VFB84_16925 [Micromonosporaceae bacterium]|nr:hypothetical protein [Micromonosporaceae bacterium]
MRRHTLLTAALVLALASASTAAASASPAPATDDLAAAVAPVEGYVWAWQPANPGYIAATGYEYSSTGGAVQVLRPAVGTYQVRFLGMAGAGGVAHAGAYGTNHLCTVSSYGPSLGDEVVNVRCFTTAGAAVDTRFVAHVTNRKDGTSRGYLWNDDPTPPAAGHTPPAAWSYDSAGQPIVVYRSAVGRYQVQLGAFAQDSPALWASGQLRATAYGSSARHCQVLDPDLVADPDLIEVHCHDDTGFNVDTRFTLTYSRKVLSASATVDLTGALPVLDGWSNTAGGAPTVAELGVGDYLVSFPNAAVPRGHATAAIMGTPPMFCTVQAWWPDAGVERIRVRCYDGNVGIPTPAVLLNVGFIA